MEQEEKAMTKNNQNEVIAMNVDDDEVVIVDPPEAPKPNVIDLTEDEEHTNMDVVDVGKTNTIYANISIQLTPGGGYHIKWIE